MIYNLSETMSTHVRRLLPAIAMFYSISAVALTPAGEELVTKAKALIANGQGVEAYQLLEANSLQHAGDPDYDYALGVAALHAEKPEYALFALERAVEVNPNYAAARMELVSAYVALGMDQQAQEQLAILETQNPPKAAQEAMARYQDVLRPRLSGAPDPVRLIGLSLGHDDNVGSYPEMELDLLGIAVEPIESPYTLLRGTLWQPFQLDDKRRLDLTVHGQMRQYSEDDAEQFDLGLLHAGVALNTSVDAVNTYSLGLQGNKIWLNDESFRNHLGLSAFWERRLAAELSGQFGLRFNTYRFEVDTNDYDEAILSGEVTSRRSAQLSLSVLAELSSESAKEDRVGGDATSISVGGKANYRVNNRNLLSAQLTLERKEYDETYSALTLYNPTESDEERTDTSTDLQLGWRYLPARKWQVDTDVTYRKQGSSVEFYEIDRITAQIGVIRYF